MFVLYIHDMTSAGETARGGEGREREALCWRGEAASQETENVPPGSREVHKLEGNVRYSFLELILMSLEQLTPVKPLSTDGGYRYRQH